MPISSLLQRLPLIITLIVSTLPRSAQSVEGMWLPMLLEALNQDEMQQLGFRLSAADVYAVNQSSLKDAVVRFGGGCTAELISSEGLLLTNHHCGYSNIQAHSSVDNDLLTDGFWAVNRAEEKNNPGLVAMFVRRMEDVTEWVLNDLDRNSAPGALREALTERKKILEARARAEWDGVLPSWDFELRAFDYGNQYILIATETYKDVRLVGAPPSSIGKFGSDTDNWVWPRHTGDFSLFRIYADADNRPAEPSETNRPLQVERPLQIELSGVQPGDFTLVYGFPGYTQEYLPAEGLRQIVEIEDSVRVAVRDRRLAVLDARMRKSDALRIRYAAQYAQIANGWKKWIGEMQGVRRSGGLERKARFDAELRERMADQQTTKAAYARLENQFDSVYRLRAEGLRWRTAYLEVLVSASASYRAMEFLGTRSGLKRGEPATEAVLSELQALLKLASDTAGMRIERETLQQIWPLFARHTRSSSGFSAFEKAASGGDWNHIWDTYYAPSILTDPKKAERWLKTAGTNSQKALDQLTKDPLFQFWASGNQWYQQTVVPQSTALDPLLTQLMAEQTRMIREAMPEFRFYPDANSTLRVSYGQVSGFSPKDGVAYLPQTYLSGMLDKYRPGDYEFDLPEKLRQLEEEHAYGPYGENGKMPLCFIASNHTTGGNSGSPALNAEGRLIGLNFDRVWEGTMSDVNYDASICRNIMVDIRFVLFVVDRYAGAGHLIGEMDLYRGGVPTAQ
ncbi:serine protease [bacterium]|nr:serine protease [bacterium]